MNKLTKREFLDLLQSGNSLRGQMVSSLTIQDAMSPGTAITAARFEQVLFKDCYFGGCRFEKVKVVKCRFENCFFDDAVFADSEFTSCQFSNCQMDSARIENGIWLYPYFHTTQAKSLIIDRVTIRLGRFIACNLTNLQAPRIALPLCSFEECDLTGADFSGATLHGANFAYANLTQANFAGAGLSVANFDGATLTETSLHGAMLAAISAKEVVGHAFDPEVLKLEGDVEIDMESIIESGASA
ncbi:MAG: pentapeptide repeat-containing protein [Deltaproteobacteria bacterium]|nr:pentapeptide repeat-containing protein [Deltaproteobacteria bacterium]MCB9488371.1 pentapeptide repeat-containing protein [Deltaproteobacteria bacterium]